MKNPVINAFAAAVTLGFVQGAEAEPPKPFVSPFIAIKFQELPEYAKCAVRVAKAAMPADYELGITRFSIPKQDTDHYSVTIGKYDELSDKALHIDWKDKNGKPVYGWELEYQAEIYTGRNSSVISVEIAEVDGYLGAAVGPAFKVVSERWTKGRPAVQIRPENIARVYRAIQRTCDLVG